MRKCLLLLTAVLSLAAAPPPRSAGPTASDDRVSIVGKWRLVSAALGFDEKKDPGDIWTITKTHFVYQSGRKAAYKLDTKKNPRQIDVVSRREDEPEEKLVGIYELKGDELRISITESKYSRPKRFALGKDHNFFVLKRVQEKKK